MIREPTLSSEATAAAAAMPAAACLAAGDWLTRITDLVDTELARLGRRRTGKPEHVRQQAITQLLRVPTESSPVWFKQIPAFFTDEARVIRWIASLAPGTVPEVLAAGNDWMITSEMPEEDDSPREHALGAMARLQISAIGKTWDTSGIEPADRPGWSFDSLLAEIETLAQRADILPAQEARTVGSLLRRLELLCDDIEKLDVPPTLVHGDFHRGNTRWTGRGWMIFDWTDAFIGHPFIDVAQPLADEGGDPAITVSYRASWATVIPAGAVNKALAAAPAIGAANHLAMHQRIVDSVPDPAAYTWPLLRWVRRMAQAIER